MQKEAEERESRIDRLYAVDAVLEDPFASVGVVPCAPGAWCVPSSASGLPDCHTQRRWWDARQSRRASAVARCLQAFRPSRCWMLRSAWTRAAS